MQLEERPQAGALLLKAVLFSGLYKWMTKRGRGDIDGIETKSSGERLRGVRILEDTAEGDGLNGAPLS